MTRSDYYAKLIKFLNSKSCKLLSTKPQQRADVLAVVNAFFDHDSFTAYDVQSLLGRDVSYSYARKIISYLLRLKCLIQLPTRYSRRVAYTFHAPAYVTARHSNKVAPDENNKRKNQSKDNKLRSNFSSQSIRKLNSRHPPKRKRRCADVYEHCEKHPSLLAEPLKIDEHYPFWRDIMRHFRNAVGERKELAQVGASVLTGWLRKVKPTIQQALQIFRIIKNYLALGAIKTVRNMLWRIRYAIAYVINRRVLKQAWYYLPPEKREKKQKPKATYTSMHTRGGQVATTAQLLTHVPISSSSSTSSSSTSSSSTRTATNPKAQPQQQQVDGDVSIADYYRQRFGVAVATADNNKPMHGFATRKLRQRLEELFPITNNITDYNSKKA